MYFLNLFIARPSFFAKDIAYSFLTDLHYHVRERFPRQSLRLADNTTAEAGRRNRGEGEKKEHGHRARAADAADHVIVPIADTR